jgi:hypothetical protein
MGKLTPQPKETTYLFSREWWQGEIVADNDDDETTLKLQIGVAASTEDLPVCTQVL